ncbi:MAG: nucleotidyltransferase domain-containing protein [Deltaproteobacteria bacterium]|nr:nucleotidyltransferase domain-containing protein [Deltaproteobacteria bacterium]
MNKIVKNWVATSNYDMQTADAMYKTGRYLYDDKMAKATPKIRSIINRYIKNLRDMGVPVERVFLFGSHASLEAGEESDVDLAVVSPLFDVSPLFERMSLWDRAGYLGKAAWDIPYPMDVLGFAPSQVRKATPGTLLNHILKHGIEITR